MIVRTLIAAALAATAAPAAAVPVPVAPATDDVARPYTRAQTAVDVERGRKLNLYCIGSGRQTVLFDAGGSDWSSTWALVQPELAADARSCAYDRAGLGYSDPAPEPRSPIAIIEDMRALIASGQVKAPVVLVGHSLGGFHVKLYAALYPKDVAGLVLVDPSEDRWWARTRAATAKQFGEQLTARSELLDSWHFERLSNRYRDCASKVAAGPLDPASDTYRRCTDPVRAPLGPLIAAERINIQKQPNYQAAQASEVVNSVYADTDNDPVYARLFRPGAFGNKPMIVLTHGTYDEKDALERLGQMQSLALHRETAKLSRAGVHRVVPDSHHNVQVDAPQAIVAAVREVLRKLGK